MPLAAFMVPGPAVDHATALGLTSPDVLAVMVVVAEGWSRSGAGGLTFIVIGISDSAAVSDLVGSATLVAVMVKSRMALKVFAAGAV
jgi:hypothetical protein